MPPRPQASTLAIRRAMKAFDWEDFLQNVGLDVTLRDEEVGGECPYCHWKRQSFYLNVTKGVFKCHYCHERGWAIKVVADTLRVSTQEAIERVMSRRHSVYEAVPWEDEEVELADDEPLEEPPPPVIELPEDFRLLAGNESQVARRYVRYALTRMTEEQMERYGVGYCHRGQYAGRIVVPVWYNGTLVSFVARAISPDAWKKVDTPKGNEQYSYLFNLERVWGRERVVITEGVFDAMALDTECVATFGKKVTDAQTIMLLNAGCRELVIAWDSDAKKEIWENYLRLRERFDKVAVIELPSGEDPASLGGDEMKRLLKTADAPTEYIAAMPDSLGHEVGKVIV